MPTKLGAESQTGSGQARAEPASSVARGVALVLAMLTAEIERMRAGGIPVGEDEYRGLYVSEGEADRLLQLAAAQLPRDGATPGMLSLRAEFDRFVQRAEGPLGRLIRLGELSAFETGVLLLGLASEADLGTERLISYVQDDVSKRRPRVDLAVRIFSNPEAGQGAALEQFHPSAPLRRLRLITLHDEPGQPHTPLLARYIALDPRIAGFLQGQHGIDESLQPHTTIVEGGEPIASFDGGLREKVDELASLPATSLQPPVVALSGQDTALVRAVGAELARADGLGLLAIPLPALALDTGLDMALTLATREAALQHAAVLFTGLDQLKPDDLLFVCDRLSTERVAPLTLLASRDGIAWPGVAVAVPELEFEGRRRLWASLLETTDGVSGDELDAIAGKFRLGTGDIREAVRAARGSALWRDPGVPVVTVDDLYAAARAQSTPILNTLAKKISPHYHWDDIILTADTYAQLREMCAQVEHRHLVYEVWGFERKLAMGKGLIALFAGPSGTGKTMAADIIAGMLKLDLYKIDLSGVVSKYIGETEKNLGSIFSEAETSNAILFFDEADALFGKRSEVKDAHDRYANIETAYLLQKMEEYSGPVILATNLKMNLDEAFMRRLHFVIDFAIPEEEERYRIWRSTMPPGVPVTGDIDLAFMAKQFKITGGNIRNIVLAAAFLAAAEDSRVGMAHLIRSTRREYQKLGRMVTEAEFGEYISLLRREPVKPDP